MKYSLKESEESDFVGTLCRWFGPTNILLCIIVLFSCDTNILPTYSPFFGIPKFDGTHSDILTWNIPLGNVKDYILVKITGNQD